MTAAATVRLAALSPSHADDVQAMFSDPEVIRFTRLPAVVPPGYAETWLRRYEEGSADGTRAGFAIVDADGAFLGCALAVSIDRAGAEAELGYMVAPAARGRGAATAGLQLLTEWALAEGLIRLELLISVENRGSQIVAERCGYELEGVLRSKHLKDGRRGDTQVWSRIAPSR